jgi:transcriptional/translational regulatory protein YebC/TACO1
MGILEIPLSGADADELSLEAIDAGASDVEVEGDTVVVYTEPSELHAVREAMLGAGREVAAAQLTMRPKTLVEPEADAAIKVIRLVEKLEDLDDVQEVFTNVDISDDVLAAAM